MIYPIAIHKDPDSHYGVTVPDLPGCFSAGSTVNETLLMAREAIELYIDTLVDDGREIPEPSDIDTLRRDPLYADAIWAFVTLDWKRKSVA